MRARRLAAMGVLLAGSLGAGVAALAQTPGYDPPGYNPIRTRQDGQLLVLGAFAGMRQAVVHKLPVKPYAVSATAIAHWMEQYPSLFPAGSETGGNTKALPAIWKSFATFQKDSTDSSAAALKLAALAKAGDTAGFAAQLKVLGRTCDTCHKEFRARPG